MRIQRSSDPGCVVLTLAGRLDLAAAPQLQRAILKQLAEQPPAIICDLDQVEAIDPLCSGVFTSIRHPALGWPATALVLCGTQPAVADTLAQLGMAPHLARAARSSGLRRATHRAASRASLCWVSRLSGDQAWPTRQRYRSSPPSWICQSTPLHSGHGNPRGPTRVGALEGLRREPLHLDLHLHVAQAGAGGGSTRLAIRLARSLPMDAALAT
jgi:anti-anti-sigma factor